MKGDYQKVQHLQGRCVWAEMPSGRERSSRSYKDILVMFFRKPVIKYVYTHNRHACVTRCIDGNEAKEVGT